MKSSLFLRHRRSHRRRRPSRSPIDFDIYDYEWILAAMVWCRRDAPVCLRLAFRCVCWNMVAARPPEIIIIIITNPTLMVLSVRNGTRVCMCVCTCVCAHAV